MRERNRAPHHFRRGLAAVAVLTTAVTTALAGTIAPAFAAGSHPAGAKATTKAVTAGVPGDVTGAGLPDVLSNQMFDLTVLPPHGSPYRASTAAQSPDGYSWTAYQVSSRGSVTGGAVSDLYAFQATTHTLYAYPNDAQFGGTPGYFTHRDKVIKVAKPATCAPGSDCTGYDPTWNSATQVLATDGVDNTDGLPDLVTMEHGKLWYYPGKAGSLLGNPVLLGTGDWSNSTVITPGKVGGTPTLWATEPSSGSIASYPLSFKADGTPTTVFAAPAPVVIQSAATTTDGITVCLSGPGSQMENCGWGPETWLLGADGTIRSHGTCLDLDPTTGAISLAACDGLPRQKWTLGSGGELIAPNDHCLTAGDPDVTDTVSLTPCTGATNQSWGVPSGKPGTPDPLPAPQAVLPQLVATLGTSVGRYGLGSLFSFGDLNGDGNPELLANASSNYGNTVFEFPGTGATNGLAWFGTPVALGYLSNPFNEVDPYGRMDNGQVLYSTCASLHMQADGNLVLVNSATGQQLWSSQTQGHPGSTALMDSSGNFVVKDGNQNTIWTSRIANQQPTSSTVILGNDCNLVLRDGNHNPVWSTRTYDPAHDTTGHAFGAGTVLHAGDRTDGATYLTMDQDGTLHLFSTASNRDLWSSGTGGHPGATATLQADGNFVIYAADGSALWSSQSSGHPGAHVTVQNDGNLVGYDADQRPLWSTGTSYTGVDSRGQAVAAGSTLAAGTTVESKAGRLVMQADGNLVLYSKATGHPLWSSNTWNNPGARAVMQADGNLVVYAASGAALWSANSGNHPSAHAVLQDDDNFVVYDTTGAPVWASGTSNTAAQGRGNVLPAGTVLHPGDKAYNTPSPLPTDLDMQADGNLVLNTVLVVGHPVWAAGTYNNAGAYATMQADGNFVIYAANGHPLWSTNTYGNPGAYLVMQTDDNVVLYDADARPLWSTNTPYWYYYGH